MSSVERCPLASAAVRLIASASPFKNAMKYRIRRTRDSSLRSIARPMVASASARRFRRSWLFALAL